MSLFSRAFLFLAFLIVNTGFSTSRAEEPAAPDAGIAYAKAIALAQADLDAGRIEAARKGLAATEKALRSFDYDYLLARVAKGTKEGTPAPDLLQKVAKPEGVEVRYGVLNPVKRTLVFICRDGSLHAHDLSGLKKEVVVAKHPDGAAIWTATFSRDGKSLFTGHQNGDVLVWDAMTGKILHTIPLGGDWPVRELAAAPDGKSFVAETKAELEIWSLAGEKPAKVAGVGERFNFGEGLAFSPAGDKIATGGMFDISIRDAKTGKELQTLHHASYTMGLEFSPDGKRIASAPRGNVNKFLAVFELDPAKQLFNAGPFGNYVVGLAFTPDGKRIAATGCEKMVRMFDATTGETTLTFNRTECSAEPFVSDDGRLLGWNEPDGFWFVELGKAK